MAWTPISGTMPQYEDDDGLPLLNHYLKFYASGTSTPILMATDSTGASQLNKCRIDNEGYPVTPSNGRFIPHIDQTYKLVLYSNGADADNNDTSAAVWEVDGIRQASSTATSSSGSTGFYSDTGVANAYALTASSETIAPTTVFEGMIIAFIATASNTAASTVTGPATAWSGPHNIVRVNGSALTGEEIQGGELVVLEYDGTDFRIITPMRAQLVLGTSADTDLVDTNVSLITGSVAPDSNQHLEYTTKAIQSKSNATTPAGFELNPLGGDVSLGNKTDGTTAGVVRVYHKSQVRLFPGDADLSIAIGVGGDPATGASTTGAFNIYNDAGYIVTSFTYGNSPNLVIRNRIRTGDMVFQTISAGGAVFDSLKLDPDGGATVTHIGTEVARSTTIAAGSWEVYSSGGGGFERVLTLNDIPAPPTQLYNAGTPTTTAVAAVAGGLTTNNQLTGAGFERVLTTSDLPATPPTVYTGRVFSTGTALSIPSGWSVIRTSLGVYQLTHNLNTDISCVVTADVSGTLAIVDASVQVVNADVINVIIGDTGSGFNRTDVAWSFFIMTL